MKKDTSMRSALRHLGVAIVAATLVACSTGSRGVDLKQARRVVGTESDVRLDAEVYGDQLSISEGIALRYDITNDRSASIAVADLIPISSYDPDTGTVTISIGSEVPGQNLLPRLLPIASGEKKSFSTMARVSVVVPSSAGVFGRVPHALQLRLNFLTDTKPFQQLLSIPERAVHDPKLATELFPKWLELNEVVITNSLPMKWSPQSGNATDASVNPPLVGGSRGKH